MAGFVLKELNNSNIVGTGAAFNQTLFTVPAGHTYMVKRAHLRIIRTAAGVDLFNLQRSDTAGANFRNIMEPIGTPAAAATAWIDLTPRNPTLQTVGAVIAEGGGAANQQFSSLENTTYEAGTVLRIGIPIGFTIGDSMDVAIDGIDNTL